MIRNEMRNKSDERMIRNEMRNKSDERMIRNRNESEVMK